MYEFVDVFHYDCREWKDGCITFSAWQLLSERPDLERQVQSKMPITKSYTLPDLDGDPGDGGTYPTVDVTWACIDVCPVQEREYTCT